MNKHGLYKAGFAIGVLAILTLAAAFMIMPLLSSQTLLKSEYFRGDTIKIPLPPGTNISIKVITPTTSYIGNFSNFIILKASDIGPYEIIFNNEIYTFQVTGNSSDSLSVLPSNNLLPSGDFSETGKVMYKGRGRSFALGKSVNFNIPRVNSSSDYNGSHSAKLYDTYGNEMGINVLVNETAGNLDVNIPPVRGLKPGQYTLMINTSSGQYGENFMWGIVSLNTLKSTYSSGENATFEIVVLDSAGRGACNAPVSLSVTSPQNRTNLITNIQQDSRECGLYYASYITGSEGVYTADVNATVENEDLAFETNFLVDNNPPYEIIRNTASKIDPTQKNSFDVNVGVTSKNSGGMNIKEYVPAAFNISNTDAQVSIEGDAKVLTWNERGSNANLKYSYSVPMVWPYLYELGPLQVNDYKEFRPWYVAVDPTFIATQLCLGVITCLTNGAPATCTCSQINTINSAYLGGGLSTSRDRAATGIINFSNSSLIPSGAVVTNASLSINWYIATRTVDYCTIMGSIDGMNTWNFLNTSCISRTTKITETYNLMGYNSTQLENFILNITAIRASNLNAVLRVDYANLMITYGFAGALNVFLSSPADHAFFNNNTITFDYQPTSNGNFLNCSLWDNATGSFALRQVNQTAIMNSTDNFFIKTYSIPPDSWYNNSWTYRKLITVPAGAVGQNLTDFPLLINLTDSDLQDFARSDGNDIVFTNVNGTKLPYQLEYFNLTYTVDSAYIVAWVKTNLSATKNNKIYMYYGNVNATNQQNASRVWNNGYVGVYHLKNSGGNLNVSDSTSNGYGGTNNGATLGPGEIDGAGSFDGTSDYVNLTDRPAFDLTGSFTITGWIDVNSFTTAWQAVITKGDSAWRVHRYQSTDNLAFGTSGLSNTDLQSSINVNDGNWHYFAAVYNGTTKILYIDGNAPDMISVTGTLSTDSYSVLIGENEQQRNRYFSGSIDEIEISNISRSAAWINAQYDNQVNSLSFYNVASPENSSTFNMTNIPADGFYIWNVLCSDNSNNATFAIFNRSFTLDTTPPVVNLIAPANNSLSVNPYGAEFDYTVSDLNNIDLCTLTLDGMDYDTNTSLGGGGASNFIEYASNGLHNWSVHCYDPAANSGQSETRNINISVPLNSWPSRWYETSVSNYTSNANIFLNTSRDSTENQVSLSVPITSTSTLINSVSPFMNGNGAILSAGTVTFSGVFSDSSANNAYITWRVYILNRGGQSVICQYGDDNTGGTRLTSTTKTTWTATCNNPTDLRLDPGDRIQYIVDAYNAQSGAATTVTHFWDALDLSYVQFANLTSIGNLTGDVTIPASPIYLNISQNFNMTCQLNCTYGYCFNTKVYAQYNTSSMDWININGTSGNLVLASNETNPHVLNNVSGVATTNFTIMGNLTTINNVRCTFVSDYSGYNGTVTQQIVVAAPNTPPTVNLTTPNGTWFNTNNFVPQGWYNGSWNYRKSFTIPAGEIGQDLTNFPLLINISDTDLHNYARTDGNDIFFTDNYGNKLAHEIEFFNKSYNSTSAYLTAWVNVNLSSSSSTTIWMYYSNPNSSNQQNASRVWNNGYVSVYHLKNSSGNLNVSDSTSNGYGGVNNGATSGTGEIDGAGSFDGTSDYVNLTDRPAFDLTGSFTITGWIDVNSFTTAWQAVITKGDSAWRIHRYQSTDNLAFGTSGLSNTDLQSSINVNDGNWHYFAAVYDGTTKRLYIDNNTPNSISVTGTLSTDAYNVLIGENEQQRNRYFNGTIDEIEISNTSRSAAWINASYWNEKNPSAFYTVGSAQTSSTPVGVMLTYYILAPNNDLQNASLYINGVYNQSNSTSIINGNQNNFTLYGFTDGLYNWTVNATVTSGRNGSDGPRYFYVDNHGPKINLTFPTLGYNTSFGDITYNFTAADAMSPTETCSITLDGAVRDGPFVVNNGTSTSRIITDQGIGFHLWNVTCYDLAGNTNTSATWNYNITSLPSKVVLLTANLSTTNTSNITLFYNTTDPIGFQKSYLILNGTVNKTNQTAVINGVNNFTVTGLSEGYYNWTVNVTNLFGTNSTNISRLFIVDKTAPNVAANLPSNNSQSITSTVSFNFTATDNIFSTLNCNLAVGNYLDSNFQVSSGVLTNRNVVGLTDGLKLWNVTCWDSAGNVNTSASRLVNITEPPKVSTSTPNQTVFNLSSFSLSYNAADNTNISACRLYINGALNQTNSSVANGAVSNFALAGMKEGNYIWSIWCNDTTYGLTNQTANKTFGVDLFAPNLTIIAPANNSAYAQSVINFTFNATDSYNATPLCNITVNGIVIDGPFNVTGGQNTTRAETFSSGGYKIWNITCWDEVMNINTSLTRNFSLSFAPTITLGFPFNSSWVNTSNVILYYLLYDPVNNINNSTLILNGNANMTNQSHLVTDGISDNLFNLNLGDGVYNWSVNAANSLGLVGNSSTWYFYVDTRSPSIVPLQPDGSTVLDWNNVTFNFTTLDNMAVNTICNLSINDFPEILNFNVTNNSVYATNFIEPDGNYTWNVACIDLAGNMNQTNDINFSIHGIPRISLDAPPDGNLSSASNWIFYYTPNDAIGISECDLYLDEVLNQTDTSVSNSQQNNFPVFGINQGPHNWTVTCFNTAGTNTTPIARAFTVDQSPPAISLDYPVNNSGVYFGTGTMSLRWTATDTYDPQLRCSVFLDGNTLVTGTPVTSGVQASWPVNPSAGYHNWSTTCWDRSQNTNQSGTAFFNFTYPDFMVNGSSIVFNNTLPKENDTVVINVTVYNLGGVSGTNVLVGLYNGDPASGGISLANNTLNINYGGSNLTTFYWNATIGTTQIFVQVNNNTAYTEWTYSNNKVSSNITVGSWQFLYGQINSESNLTLSDSNNSLLRAWSANLFDMGNIFVTSSGTIVNWPALKALGRNTAGGNSPNDFSSLDSLLNMTGFNDSVSNLYTSGGNPNTLINFTIFNTLVTNVPVVNSINNSNFTTGILWDSSPPPSGNDTDGQFDIPDRENIVFVSKINRNTFGTYGTYDYEIRVPAGLRTYKSSSASAGVVYLELK